MSILNNYYGLNGVNTYIKRIRHGVIPPAGAELIETVNKEIDEEGGGIGLPLYHFYRVQGNAWQEHESYISQFINLNNYTRENITRGGPGVPDDFKINVPPYNALINLNYPTRTAIRNALQNFNGGSRTKKIKRRSRSRKYKRQTKRR